MNWLQENWIVAVVIAIVVIALLWWLLAPRRAEDAAPPTFEPAAPAKPLAPAKPDIVAAEPASFKPRDPAPQPTPPPAAPEPAPVAAPAPRAEPVAAPPPEPSAPATGAADNLQLLKGIGPKLVTVLAGLGVTRFDQIAAWTDDDIATIDARLGNFQGRIGRDNWVDQASYLARGDKVGFEAKYGALGGEL